MIQCPHCQRSEWQVKPGFNDSGSQRYLCHVCRWKYTPDPKAQGYASATRQKSLRLYADGMNLRRVARTLGVTHPTVVHWVNARAAQLPDTPPQPANLAVCAASTMSEPLLTVERLKKYFLLTRGPYLPPRSVN